jgi:predicted ester cyclase
MAKIDLKALEHLFFDEWNKGKAALLAVIDKTCADNMVFHSGVGKETRGLNELKQYMSMLCDAIPDCHITIDDMVVEGDKVAYRYTLTGTHKGVFMGIPATNKKVAIWILAFDHFVGAKMVEGWSRFDTLGFMQQLGVVPMPGTRK